MVDALGLRADRQSAGDRHGKRVPGCRPGPHGRGGRDRREAAVAGEIGPSPARCPGHGQRFGARLGPGSGMACASSLRRDYRLGGGTQSCLERLVDQLVVRGRPCGARRVQGVAGADEGGADFRRLLRKYHGWLSIRPAHRAGRVARRRRPRRRYVGGVGRLASCAHPRPPFRVALEARMTTV